jgi:hypothetical protein
MAIQVSSARASVTSAPSYNADYTLMSWVRKGSIAFNSLWMISGNIGTNSDLDAISIDGSGKMEVDIKASNSYISAKLGPTALANNTWYHITQVRSGITVSVLLGTQSANAAFEVEAGGSVAGRSTAAAAVALGGWESVASGFQFFGTKVFASALTTTQVVNEQWKLAPSQAPWALWPHLNEDGFDWSGNSRSLTTSGAILFTSPPISYGGSGVNAGIPTAVVAAQVDLQSGTACWNAYQPQALADDPPTAPPTVASSFGFVEPCGVKAAGEYVSRFAIGNVEDR